MGKDPEYAIPAEASASIAVYKAYGSGAPNWFGLPIFVVFFLIVVVALAPEALHPHRLRGFGGYLVFIMYKLVFLVAAMAAFAVWRWLTFRLRDKYPDKVIVSADQVGIGLPSGKLIPYRSIRRIDPCFRGNDFISDTSIQIVADRWRPWKIDLNMSIDAPEDVLANLRERALSGGASLAPAWPNGRKPPGGSQLGYRQGMGWRG